MPIAAVVRFFIPVISGDMLRKILNRLNAEGFRTRKGNKINMNFVSRMLRNLKPFPVGEGVNVMLSLEECWRIDNLCCQLFIFKASCPSIDLCPGSALRKNTFLDSRMIVAH